MDAEIKGKPAFAYVDFNLSPGDSIVAESDAMSSMSAELDVDAKFNGSFLSAFCKKLFGRESLFVNEFTNNTTEDKNLTIAQGFPGDIYKWQLDGGSFCFQPGAYIASTPDTILGLGWAGIASMVGREGLFRLSVQGQGSVWFGAYGALVEKELDGECIVDTGHLVAYEPTINLHMQLAGGIFSSLFSGEGLVTRLEGKGKYYLQTRSISGLAGWLNPKIV